MQWKSPHFIRPGHGNVQEALVERQGESVGRDAVVHQPIKSAIGSKTIHSARLISHAGLSLIGEENVVLAVDDYIIDSLETLEIVPCEQIRHLVCAWIEE